MRKLLAIALLLTTPAWGQFSMSTPLLTNIGGPGCPATATGPQPASIRGSAINSAVAPAFCVTTALPANAQSGDFAVSFFSSGDDAGLTPPSGWTTIAQTPTTEVDWNTIASYRTLTTGDISTGSITNCSPNSVGFDVHQGVVVFAGGTGSIRESENVYSSANNSLTNVTTSGVQSTDVGIYWGTGRYNNYPQSALIGIVPASGSAAYLHGIISTNACSLLAAQQMPGGALSVETTYGTGVALGSNAFTVVVENP